MEQLKALMLVLVDAEFNSEVKMKEAMQVRYHPILSFNKTEVKCHLIDY
jgi:hypothetical protein